MDLPEPGRPDAADGVPDAKRLLAIAVDVVRPAAELAVRLRRSGVRDVSTKSTETDVVTAADRAVERLVVGALRAVRPGDGVLAEESAGGAQPEPGFGGGEHPPRVTGGAQPEPGFGGGEHPPRVTGGAQPEPGFGGGGTRIRWILDPIDGTVNYLYGIPQYAVSLAAEVDGTVVAGVVRNAATGEEWTAIRGGGAYRDGRRLAGSRVRELGQALLATGFGYGAARRAHQARVLAELLPVVRDVRRLGAAALDLCLVAEGILDLYYEKGLNLWDHAAGGLIAAEAGLRVTGLAGAPPGPDLVIAAPPALYDDLHDRLVALDAAGGP